MKERDDFMIEKRSLAEQVYMYLCNAIIGGKFSYGETISTKNLAEELQVSMMPIREALKRLELDGIVEIKPRSMCVFKTPTKKTILSAIDVRELLEVHCVRTVYQHISTERLAPLREITREMAASIEAGKVDIKRYISYDWQFHVELCSLAENEFINKFYRELNLHLNMNYMYDIGIKPNVSQTFQDHVNLVDAMEKHSPKSIEIIENHLKISRNNVLNGVFFKTKE